ncbi:MAG: TRAP transporter small permease subunit [Chromatiales bacterium]|nr:TRAP transporter small permease subunit [Chromatiales bacterium]
MIANSEAIADRLDALVQGIGRFMAWSNVVLIGVILLQVILRYGFDRPMASLEELMWHLNGLAFLLGASYALSRDSHIRVDVIHTGLSSRKQQWIEILGILLLLYPFLAVVFFHSLDWVAESYRWGESSPNPTGLPYRWMIKATIPLGFSLLFLAATARLLREIARLAGHRPEPPDALTRRLSGKS